VEYLINFRDEATLDLTAIMPGARASGRRP
jgi:hypothetical protein